MQLSSERIGREDTQECSYKHITAQEMQIVLNSALASLEKITFSIGKIGRQSLMRKHMLNAKKEDIFTVKKEGGRTCISFSENKICPANKFAEKAFEDWLKNPKEQPKMYFDLI